MSGMLTFGDSIMAGWDGKEYVSQPVPQQIGSLLGIVSVNAAVSSTRIVSGPQNLLEMIKTVDMTGYDLIMLGYGTNDWGYQDETLDDMRMGLDTFKSTLRSKNPNAKVFYELPMEQFGWGSKSLDDKNSEGLSQNDVINFLKQYAENSGWGYYDWRSDPLITYANRMTTTGDNGWGHPTPPVMKQMAERLAQAIKPYVPGSGNANTSDDTTPTTPDNLSNPAQPSEPSKQALSHLSLDKMPDDPFNLKDNVAGNITKTVASLNSIYQFCEKLLGLDKVTIKINTTVKNDGLDRLLRNFVIRSFDQLKEDVNDVVNAFNENELWNFKTGEKIELLVIERPQQLTLGSDYLAVVNNNWKAIENKVNELVDIINQFIH